MEQTARLGLELIGEHAYDRLFLSQDKLDLASKTRTSAFPWRGQFSPEFIEALLDAYASPKARILDPFVGSGTVLFESANRGYASDGVEINPAAYELSYIATLSSVSLQDRKKTYLDMLEALAPMMAMSFDSLNIEEDEGKATVLQALNAVRSESRHVIRVAIMLALGNNKVLKKEKLVKSLAAIRQVMSSLPAISVPTSTRIGDARVLAFEDCAFDLTITSPPYINVFNYHQNYRPAIELMDYQPLSAARSEIGSNRSNRQNRFLTVVQYCLDMQMVLTEVGRVTKPEGVLVLVVGKESRVRGVPFANANLLGAIATKSGIYRLVRRQQRKFINRYGEAIYEDVLTLEVNKRIDKVADLSLGRAAAKLALIEARATAKGSAQEDVAEAIDAIDTIAPSKMAA